MRRFVSLLCVAIMLLSCSSCAFRNSKDSFVTELGIPLEESYPEGGQERCAWDIEYYNGALYVGSGDYDLNRGPVRMVHYDFAAGEWVTDDYFGDEQIERFYIFNDILYAPGCDSRGSWEFGNYFTCDKTGKWVMNRTLPNGVHNFDLVMFEGKLFAGLGVEEGNSPIVVTTDEQTWEQVPLLKDGKPRETYGGAVIRVYDFFVLDNTLYAYFYLNSDTQKAREIYRYDGENFVYHSNMTKTMSFAKRVKFAHFNAKIEFKGDQYISTGSLYKTADMITAEYINLGSEVEVADIRVIGDAMYLLCNEMFVDEKGDAGFRISVRKTEDGKVFSKLFDFEYPVRALSFTYNDGTFYFGMGNGVTTDNCYEKNGMILAVEFTA